MTTQTVKAHGVEVTLRRRTVLSDAKANAIILKMALFFVELALELDDEANAVDAALSTFARISSQAVGQGKGIDLASPGDSLDVLRIKSRAWLIDTHPDVATALYQGLDTVDATWNEPAMAPLLPDNADPKQ